jgi:hypothetical protein
MLFRGHMHFEEHGSMAFAAKSPAYPLKVAGLGRGEKNFGGLAPCHRRIHVEIGNQQAVGHVIGGQDQFDGLALFQRDFCWYKRKLPRMNFNGARRFLGVSNGGSADAQSTCEEQGSKSEPFHENRLQDPGRSGKRCPGI